MDDAHAYCPHCRALLLLDAPHPFPERPVRCSGCRLLVGSGRSRDAGGRSRRASARVAPAPAQDPVMGVLADLHGQTLDAELHGVRALVGDR